MEFAYIYTLLKIKYYLYYIEYLIVSILYYLFHYSQAAILSLFVFRYDKFVPQARH